jgi:hypothetical protein
MIKGIYDGIKKIDECQWYRYGVGRLPVTQRTKFNTMNMLSVGIKCQKLRYPPSGGPGGEKATERISGSLIKTLFE